MKKEKKKEVKNEEGIKGKKDNKDVSKINNKLFIIGGICVAIVVFTLLMVTSKEGNVKFKVKSSLDRLVEKSDLETVNFTYNVIAKKCKKKDKCNKKSNNIDDFKYVVSCKGKVTAGIDFKDVKVEIDEDNKKLLITMPDAEVKDINVLSTKFLNGEDLSASELVNARELCDATVEERSKNDAELLSVAKEQAEVVLESFYSSWIKSFDEEYKVEIK